MQHDPLDLIEAAVFEPKLWPAALEAMERAHNAQIFSLMRESPVGLELLAAPHAETARSVYLREGWVEHDIRTQRGVRYPEQFRLMTDDILVRPEERSEGLFYRDFAEASTCPTASLGASPTTTRLSCGRTCARKAPARRAKPTRRR